MFAILAASSNFALLRPLTPECRQWLREHVQPGALWWAGALVVEYRYLDDLVTALEAAGFGAHGPTGAWQ